MCDFFSVAGFFLLIEVAYHQTFGAVSSDLTFLPRTKRYRIKSGTSISLSCNKIKNDIEWQFKPCIMNYKGMNCDNEEEFNTYQGTSRKLLQHFNKIKIIRIENASLDDVGKYRCISGNLIRKMFILEIDAVTFVWPPPKVISVVPNQKMIHINSPLTINCSVSSRTPPKILWFKVCWTNMCELDFAAYDIEIEENFNCLCLINSASNNTYNWENLYVSKLHIFKTHMWDGGTYVCSALSSDGKDYKNVTISVEFEKQQYSNSFKSYITLLFIPLIFLLLYVLCYIICASKRKKSINNEQLQHLKSKTHVIPVK